MAFHQGLHCLVKYSEMKRARKIKKKKRLFGKIDTDMKYFTYSNQNSFILSNSADPDEMPPHVTIH